MSLPDLARLEMLEQRHEILNKHIRELETEARELEELARIGALPNERWQTFNARNSLVGIEIGAMLADIEKILAGMDHDGSHAQP